MSDKLDQADETIDIFDAVVRERDELRTEDERLRVSSTRPDAGAWVHRQAELQAEVERLKAAVAELQQDVERLQQQRAEQMLAVERLRAAALKLDGYWISDTYDPGTKNVTVRLDAFAELRDLLGLKQKTYEDPTAPVRPKEC